MSLSAAQEYAWSLATTLMACITLFKAESGYDVMPAPSSTAHPNLSFTSMIRSRGDGGHPRRDARLCAIAKSAKEASCKRCFRFRLHQPFGQVPWLTDGNLSIFESGAIPLHLAETHIRVPLAERCADGRHRHPRLGLRQPPRTQSLNL